MSLKQALFVREWLGSVLEAYSQYLMSGEKRYPYAGNLSGDWDSESRLRVSKLGSICPKLNGAIATKTIEKPEIPFSGWMRMENGTRWAEIVYEAISWGASTNDILTFEAEHRVVDHWSGLSGTIDCLLKLDVNGDRYTFPVEVKRTDNDKYKGKGVSGLSYHQWLQTIGEMVLLSPEEGNYGYTPYGYTFTIYSPDSDPSYRVWLTTWDEGHQGWHLYNIASTGDSEWPTETSYSKNIFLSLEQFKEIVNQYQYYINFSDEENVYSTGKPYELFESWHCGKVIKPDYYKSNTKYGNIGDTKDGTGIIIPKCPLFKYCYANELFEAGYKPTAELPSKLDLIYNNGELELKGHN